MVVEVAAVGVDGLCEVVGGAPGVADHRLCPADLAEARGED
ncbi:hypothetical protein ACWC9H_07835 [Streptomyces sp. NPDC001251]